MEMYVQAWIWMGLYVVMIPVLYFVVLLLNRKYIKMDPDNVHNNIPDEDHAKVILVRSSYGGIYSSFKRKYFYFELVEMVENYTSRRFDIAWGRCTRCLLE